MSHFSEELNPNTMSNTTQAASETDKHVQGYADLLKASHTRAGLVDYRLKGNVYGHPNLVNVAFTASPVSHETLGKTLTALKAKIGDVQPGLNLSGSDCFIIPEEFTPEVEGKRASPTGVVKYHLSEMNAKPGKYVFIGAAEAMVTHFLQHLVGFVKQKKTGANSTQILRMIHLVEMMSTSTDRLISFVQGFHGHWTSTTDPLDKETGTKGKLKRVWVPLPIRANQGAVMLTLDNKYIVDKIIHTRDEARKARGVNLHAIHQEMLDSAVIEPYKPPVKAKTTAKTSVKAVSAFDPPPMVVSKKKEAPVKTELQKIIAADRKSGPTRKVIKPSDPTYNPSHLLSQSKMVRAILEGIPGSKAIISKVSADVKRFIDDLFNEIVITLTDAAVNIMVVNGTTTLSNTIAIAAVKTYLSVVQGSDPSDLKNKVSAMISAIIATTERLSVEKKRKVGMATERRLERKSKLEGSAFDAPPPSTGFESPSASSSTEASDEEADDNDNDEVISSTVAEPGINREEMVDGSVTLQANFDPNNLPSI